MNEISVAMDEVMAAIKKIEQSHAEFPEPGALAHTSGPAAGASAVFRSELNLAAHQISATTEAIRQELLSIQDSIQQAAQGLLDADSSIGGDLTNLTGVLESASVPAGTTGGTSTAVKPPPPTSAAAAANSI